ncbi:MAG: TonB-dependent receptor, partial [Bacteroidales bacterium]|nr:TonB-dependent receptor [Bacteroidales bacterium]
RLKLLPGIRFSLFTGKDYNYFKPEPRISASYSIMEDLALKASYVRMNQYVHLLSNTGLGLPTDLWVPSVTNVPPQESWQLAAGIAKDFIDPDISLTIEGYYKEGNNILGYKEGASFIMFNDPSEATRFDWTSNVTSGFGKAYGAELFIQKKSGLFTGWIGYTLSWVIHQFDDVNNGVAFFGKYDRRHDISIVLNYRITPKLNLSCVWVYSTGNPITIPLSTSYSYSYNEGIDQNQGQGVGYSQYTYEYEGKNSFRAAPYHRLDFGAQFIDQVTIFKHKVERVIDLSIYNAYSRKNPFFYYWDQEYNEADGSSKHVLKQLSLFPIIPSLSLSYKF